MTSRCRMDQSEKALQERICSHRGTFCYRLRWCLQQIQANQHYHQLYY